MAENNLHSHQTSESVGHEVTDVNAWAIGKFAIALTLITIASLGMLLGLFHYFLAEEGGTAPAITKFPPSPQLQMAPARDLQAMRATEDHLLNSYGWVDKSKGIVHIPIDRAIDMVAQKGLPSRPADQAPKSTVSQPTESGLGVQQ